MPEVFLHQRHNARIAGCFLILSERLQRNNARPPVVVCCGTDHAIRHLVVKGPIDIALRLGLETSIVEQVGKRQQAVEIIRTALPRLAGSTQPSTVRANVCPSLIEMTTQSIGLNLKLISQPSAR